MEFTVYVGSVGTSSCNMYYKLYKVHFRTDRVQATHFRPPYITIDETRLIIAIYNFT